VGCGTWRARLACRDRLRQGVDERRTRGVVRVRRLGAAEQAAQAALVAAQRGFELAAVEGRVHGETIACVDERQRNDRLSFGRAAA
jgi:hypothetical protein